MNFVNLDLLDLMLLSNWIICIKVLCNVILKFDMNGTVYKNLIIIICHQGLFYF